MNYAATSSQNSVYSTYADLWNVDADESKTELQAALEESLTSKQSRLCDIKGFNYALSHCSVYCCP